MTDDLHDHYQAKYETLFDVAADLRAALKDIYNGCCFDASAMPVEMLRDFPAIIRDAADNALRDSAWVAKAEHVRDMDDARREARQPSVEDVQAMLAAMAAIPDDPPGSDEEFMRAIDAERPHRPLFAEQLRRIDEERARGGEGGTT